MLERRLAYCDPRRMSEDDSGDGTPLQTLDGRQANVISSLLADGTHAPVLDIDFPCAVLPSSTPGHYHLYIDKPLTWEEYEEVLIVLARVGLIGQNYAHHSIARGQTVVRMPWVNKLGPRPPDCWICHAVPIDGKCPTDASHTQEEPF